MDDRQYWLKQTTETASYPDMHWSRPENKLHAGKLLIIGGNVHGFSVPAQAYGAALAAGIGSVRVLLPDSLQKAVSKLFPEAEFAPSTPSGSFAKSALSEVLSLVNWADGVFVAGDLGRNSETAILLERLIDSYDGQLTLTRDAADVLCRQPLPITQRAATTLVLSAGQLQELATSLRFGRAFTSKMGLIALIETLHEFTKRYDFNIVTKQYDNYVVALAGRVSTTKLSSPRPIWRVAVAAQTATWWLQNPSKPFEALTSAVYNVA